jgi:VIT1/CCC1 family predicted Fe2+/Mn2+ transporter
MGAGEFVSVRSQRELLAASVPDTRDAASVLPRLDVNANELALVYRARGVEPVEADRRAREVLGSDDPRGHRQRGRGGRRRGPRGGRVEPRPPRLSSFCFFASGAAIPVLPFLFGLPELVALGSRACSWGSR